MGQDHSSGKRGQEAEAYGNVFVKLDQDTYLSDDTVTGTIYVQLKRPYPGDKICLKVKGKEFTKWIDKEHKQRQREDGTIEHYTVDVPREAEFVPVKHVVDIYDWRNGNVIPPGQYSFPISFKIPPGLPSTFFLRSGTTVAEISYYVEAYLKPEKELYPKIKHKRPITVRQALRGDITTKEVSINQEVSTCCCLGKGSVAMWTAFEKNAYAPGEEARIVTEVDNSKCELAITNVRFELVQYIKLTAQNNSKALHFGIIGENLGRVEPGQAFLKDQRKEASIHLPPGIEGSAKAYKGDNQVQEYNLSPQQAISPSANGNLIKSNFGLRVACGMDGCVCDTMPTTELPITIYSIIQRKVADPLPPPSWNPTPMPASNISIVISINGVAPSTISAGPAQPQNNTLMTNNQMPTQQSNYQPVPQQGQGQYQQQSQYTQQSQQPLSHRQQEAQYQQESQYRQQEQRPPQYQQQQPLSQAQSIQSLQSKTQYQQESQYQQQQSPTRYQQESQQYRQQEQAQYQQPLSNRQSESQYRQEQAQSNRVQESQYRQQEQSPPRQQYQQEQAQYQQPLSNRQSESQYRQEQAQSNRVQESQYRQQEQSPPRQQQQQSLQKQPQTYSQSQIQIQPKQQSHQDLQYRQQEQSPTRQQYQQESTQYRQQESPLRQSQEYRQQQQSPPKQQYQQEQKPPQYQQESSQYRQNQPPLRQSNSQYQYQDSQSRHQEQASPPRQHYQQESSQYQSQQRYQQEPQQYRQQEQSPTRQQYQQQQQNNYQYSEQNYNSQSQYGRGGERY